MSAQPNADTVAQPRGGFLSYFRQHPKGFWFFFWGEFAERCSYYGMRVLLFIYISAQLGLGEENATTIMSVFFAAAYVLPLLGGYVADRYLGKYWTIVAFSLPYVIGQLLIGIPNPVFLVIALTLLAMGSGVIKPNISTLMGLTYDQKCPGNARLRSEAFAMFYFAINIGALLSQTAMPIIKTKYGYQVAFLLPALVMTVALTIFALGKRYYAVQHIERGTIDPAVRGDRWKIIRRVSGLFFLIMFFWAAYDQKTSIWVAFANKYIDCRLLGTSIAPEQFQALNPFFILTLLPIITYLWRVLDSRGWHVRPTDKIVAGFLLTAGALASMSIAGAMAGKPDVITIDEIQLDNGQPFTFEFVAADEKSPMVFLVLAYLLLTTAEILISVTGLELAYTAAPKSMSGVVTGCWLFTVGIANLAINTPMGYVYKRLPPNLYFGLWCGILIAVAIAFVFVARRFNASARQSPEV